MVSAAAQAGVVAACVVLFVPMGLAGWHLSRNKVLFFSGALFVSLAVGVHLSPYLPSLPHLLLAASFHPHPISSSSSSSAASSSCVPLLHRVSWADAGGESGVRRGCLVLALLRLLVDPGPPRRAAEPELFRRHSDYRATVPARGISVDFVWAPFESNLTRLLHEDLRLAPRTPDVLVLGSGLWHMLHVTDAARYGDALASVVDAAKSLRSPLPVPPPHMFWLGLPLLVNHMLNTDAKKVHMNDTILQAYDLEVEQRGLLQRDGGPFLLLDVGKLSRGCGQQCTADGMHYDGDVYDAVLHIMLNALVIESQQRI
ncbi:hypothetical protein OsJ_32303 [Oryza sativa Japonica Group]|uniref:Uncharacterized protein n=1 Tax=Oryza sativa subsp. japonica TaxID=39947 RepID=A3C6W9_ORYSJ|nr:hypothetical protein OsJ_32303 [Oryza sativa Japonica Group]